MEDAKSPQNYLPSLLSWSSRQTEPKTSSLVGKEGVLKGQRKPDVAGIYGGMMRKRRVGLYRSLRNYFDRNDCLVRLSEDMKRPFVGSRVDDEPKVVLCFLLAQLRNIYESATILCRLGFPQPAYVLLRSLQEGCIRICYILHEGEREAIVERASQKSPCNKKIVKDIHIRKGILGQTSLMRGILMNSRVWNHLSGLRHAARPRD